MDREKLIETAKYLYEQAFEANIYYNIMMQYGNYQDEYANEIDVSRGFYDIVYTSLNESCFMDVAKLFDSSNKSITIRMLLDECYKNIGLFPEYRYITTYEDDGMIIKVEVPYLYQFKSGDEHLLTDDPEIKEAIVQACAILSSNNTPIKIELSFSKYLEVLIKHDQSLKKKKDKIHLQRNKIYAHNGLDSTSVAKNNPILFKDLKDLIDYALECTRLILGSLTGKCYPTEPININDWQHTLRLVRIGYKYQNYKNALT